MGQDSLFHRWVAPVARLRATGVAQPEEVANSTDFVQDSVMGNKRQIVDGQLYVHFITFSVYRRRKLLGKNNGSGLFVSPPAEKAGSQSNPRAGSGADVGA
jgi:hypothetical protein